MILLWLLLQTPVSRPYWPVALGKVATTTHTHIQVRGTVTYVAHETDGDLHIRLSDSTGTLVAECIPSLPCRVPKVGETITVRGISRRDPEHLWWELHPVEWMSP